MDRNTFVNPRSFKGCVRCRKRRQKCGEQKPSCARCLQANVECSYEVKLRWGGRSFSQSRFGKCLADSPKAARKLESGQGSFVYTIYPPTTIESQHIIEDESEINSLIPISSEDDIGTELSTNLLLPTFLDPFSSLSFTDRSLIDYFIRNASRTFASHSFVHEEVCNVILPMALDNRALLYATMSLSAMHQTSITSEGVEDSAGKQLVDKLKAMSMRSLRKSLQQPDVKQIGPLLATARTLFLCEALSGQQGTHTWRAHFEGARAMIASLGNQNPQDSNFQFLRRWYDITEALVSVTSEGLSQSLPEESHTLVGDEEGDQGSIDVYLGCTNDLLKIFRQIGAIASKRKLAIRDSNQEQLKHCIREADWLELSIRRLMERDKTFLPQFRTSVIHALTFQQAKEFMLCNEAYHHTALIHIYRRIRNLASSSPTVQNSVKSICECIESIEMAAELSPLTLLTTPLFTAGCEAFGPERARIRRLLTNMYKYMCLPNMKRSLEMLEVFWNESNGDDWETFMRRRNWDFIPY